MYKEGNALDIARRRYAAGEIAREQFDQIRGDLQTRADGLRDELGLRGLAEEAGRLGWCAVLVWWRPYGA